MRAVDAGSGEPCGAGVSGGSRQCRVRAATPVVLEVRLAIPVPRPPARKSAGARRRRKSSARGQMSPRRLGAAHRGFLGVERRSQNCLPQCRLLKKSRARLARAGIRGLGRSNKSAYCQEPGTAGTKRVSRSDASAYRAIMDSPRLPCGIVEISPSPAIAGPVTVSSGANPVFGICLSCRLGVELPC